MGYRQGQWKGKNFSLSFSGEAAKKLHIVYNAFLNVIFYLCVLEALKSQMKSSNMGRGHSVLEMVQDVPSIYVINSTGLHCNKEGNFSHVVRYTR